MPTQDMPGMPPEIRTFYEQITKLTDGGSPEAIRERYAALDAFELIGEVYYYQWLGNGEILPQALENCLDAKAHFETARRLESEYKNKEENKMAFFDKLNDLAKNIGEKTNVAIETTKLNSKINAEKSAAAEDLKKIGEYYYSLFAASGEATPEVLELCQSAKTHYDAAAATQTEIERIKAENEAEKAPAAAPAGVTCPSCGAANGAGTKFCRSCGAKLEAMQQQERKCPACGAAVAPGVRFCSECGQKMEE